jgi:adenosylcobinamide kinase/adenosylcobinamide-phosphate guanylyltransferase
MKIFITGGCKNGKSYYAQQLALAQRKDKLYYVATMRSADSEDDERIKRHKKERDGLGFITVEQPVNVEEILVKIRPDGSIILDSLTALLANEMFLPDGGINGRAAAKISDAVACILANQDNIVIVSDFIYSDAHIYDELTEKFRKSLAEIDRVAADKCETVLEAAYSNIITHKGKLNVDAAKVF